MKYYLLILIMTLSSMDMSAMPETQVHKNDTIYSDPEQFLKNLYTDYVFGNKNFKKIKSHFSKKIIKKLTDSYSYDGKGYATWLFRTGYQDGPSDISSVYEIIPEAQNWFRVTYSDMGHLGVTRFKVKMIGERVFIDDFQ